jgi:hypothetical protein
MGRYVAIESIKDNTISVIECYMLRSEITEQRTLNQRVQGSSPCAPTKFPTEINKLEFGH